MALLDEGAAVGPLTGWQVPLVWLAVAGAVLIGAWLMAGLLSAVPRRWLGRRRFTPLLILPLAALGEGVRAGTIVLLGAADWPTMPELMAHFARTALVLLVLDVMHALYVVPLHPLARRTLAPMEDQTEPEVTAAPPEETLPAQPAVEEIRIADRSFAVEDILWIRTEDHYLNVVTNKGRSMLRAKLSDLQGLQDGRTGLQVNRSHWVAFAAIRETQEEAGGQLLLRLVTGEETSVARSRRILFRQMQQAWRSRQGV